MSTLLELGRTRLFTRRQRLRLVAVVLSVPIGILLATWVGSGLVAWLSGLGWQSLRISVRPPVTGGSGGLLGVPVSGQSGPPSQPQFPLTVTWPTAVPGWGAALAAAPVWVGWTWGVSWPLLRGLQQETRHRGLASRRVIRRALGPGAARRAGKFTRPELSWWQRHLLHTNEFGLSLGKPIRPRSRRQRLVADWEQRVRIIARTGWGKTSRVLVPIIRALPGPAVISSTEPAIFEQTVRARQWRRTRLRWAWLDRLVRRWLPVREYPVAVADFSDPNARYAADYPRVHWDPIDGCREFAVAYRRAVAQVAGAEADSGDDRGNEKDSFFRDSAGEVLAAWLHAADLGDYGVGDLAAWQREPQDPRPRRVLEDHPDADPTARMSLDKHLDPRAERTSSGVERYLTLALRALTSTDGLEFCGKRFDDAGNRLGAGFDLTGFIEEGGTVYVLADPLRIDRARPLLSLFATEMYYAAEAAALRRRGAKRLPQPFIGVHDELRYGIPISALPYVASAQRKYGIGYVYSVQSSSQEDAVYGGDAPALRDAAGASLYGGIDITAARELSERAGTTSVVTPSHGDLSSQSLQQQDALTIADQQQLADGESVVVARGLTPFLAWTSSIYDHRRTRSRIAGEADTVARNVAGARAREHATQHATSAAAEAGANLRKDPLT